MKILPDDADKYKNQSIYHSRNQFIDIKFERMNMQFGNKTVLVTGGTGSFGKNFIKKILEHDVKRSLFSVSENEHV